LKAVHLEAFRAYRNEQSFDLAAPITVLYGQNGLGKTSVFDAIDFACTGRIGRLSRIKRSVEEFAALATHLDKGEAQAEVVLEFEVTDDSGTVDYRSRRSVKDTNACWIDTRRLDRKSLLTLLTGVTSNTKLTINHLEPLFRATHLFGQDDQELLLEFRRNSFIPNDLFSRMIALDDYTAGLTKVERVEKLVGQWLQRESETNRDLSEQLLQKQRHLDRLKQSLEASSDLLPLDQLSLQLSAQVSSILNLEVAISEGALAETKAIAKAELATASRELSTLADLKTQWTSNVENRNKSEAESKELALLVTKSKSLMERISELNSAVSRTEELLTRNQDLQRSAQDRLDSLKVLGQLRRTIRDLDTQLEKLRSAGKINKQSVTEQQLNLKNAAAILAQATKLLSELEASKTAASRKLDATTELVQMAERLGSMSKKQRERREHLESLRKSLANTRSEMAALKVDSDTAKTKLEKLSLSHKLISESSTDLTRLLDEIEQFVDDDNCPACGSPFEDQSKVLNAIRSRKDSRSSEASRVFDTLSATRKQDAALDLRITESNRQEGDLSRRVSDFENDIEVAGREIGVIEARFREKGMTTELKSLREAREIAKREFEDCSVKVTSQQKELARAESERLARDKTVQDLLKSSASDIDAIADTESKRSRLAEQLRESIGKLGIAEDVSDSDLQSSESDCQRELTEIRKQRESAVQQLNRQKTDLLSVRKNRDLVDESIESLRRSNDVTSTRIQLFEEKVADLGITNLASEGAISDRIAKAQRYRIELRELEKLMVQVESAMNAEITEKEIAAISQDIADIELSQKSALVQKNAAAANKKSVGTLRKLLAEYRRIAIAKHIDLYGPFISILQRRLRAVFGFEEIHLVPTEDKVVVEARWGDRQVKPVDYFSDSQKQILMLSVFLGSCLRQNWSGFSPILLDDPVTHFDDLNAHAFVELIRGLVATEPDRWQFVISTCEDRLYSLMRKKFSHGESAATFYHFKGMTSEGPVVERES
jgi:exonuclease SbcC